MAADFLLITSQHSELSLMRITVIESPLSNSSALFQLPSFVICKEERKSHLTERSSNRAHNKISKSFNDSCIKSCADVDLAEQFQDAEM